MKVIIRGSWSNCVGTDYCDALGEYPSLDNPFCQDDAYNHASNSWEPDLDDDGLEDDGPNYWVEEYDPSVHDMLKSGGGSFEDDFTRMR